MAPCSVIGYKTYAKQILLIVEVYSDCIYSSMFTSPCWIAQCPYAQAHNYITKVKVLVTYKVSQKYEKKILQKKNQMYFAERQCVTK